MKNAFMCLSEQNKLMCLVNSESYNLQKQISHIMCKGITNKHFRRVPNTPLLLLEWTSWKSSFHFFKPS